MTAAMPVMADEIASWLSELQSGAAKTAVMSDGKGYSFNCDGASCHYIYSNDVTRREPNGRFKRVYTGKIENGHVTYKDETKEIPCKARYERWANSSHVNCRLLKAKGSDAGRAGDAERRAEYVSV